MWQRRQRPRREAGPARTPRAASATSSLASRRRRPSIRHVEEAHPAEFRELGLVRVEHERPGVRELDLEHAALALALHHRVGVLPVLARAGRLIAEELAVQMERVDEVELRE